MRATACTESGLSAGFTLFLGLILTRDSADEMVLETADFFARRAQEADAAAAQAAWDKVGSASPMERDAWAKQG